MEHGLFDDNRYIRIIDKTAPQWTPQNFGLVGLIPHLPGEGC